MSSPRISGLQADVRSLYRQLIRAAASKDGNRCSPLVIYVKSAFKDKAFRIKRNDFKIIEHMLRYGHKQLKLLAMPGFKGAQVLVNPKEDKATDL